jgi:hypothetical protein
VVASVSVSVHASVSASAGGWYARGRGEGVQAGDISESAAKIRCNLHGTIVRRMGEILCKTAGGGSG